MPALVPNSAVEGALRIALEREGFALSPQRGHGETGVDIVAVKANESWHIECIGYKQAGAARAKDFYESFFRVISRLNDGATHLVIALARRAEVGLPARARQHRVAWERIAEAFPELEIWLVDTDQQTYSRQRWGEWVSS
jgi:hypothetical protein